MTALNLPGFDDGEPTLEVWENDWYFVTAGWYWHDWAQNSDHSHKVGPFATRDLALADAKANGADTREENVV